MIFGKLQLYVIIGLGAFSVVSAGSAYILWGKYSDAKAELKAVQIARDKAEENLTLVSQQLEKERRTRVAVETALSDLRSVPNEEYETPLPPGVSDVLRNFRERMQ